MPPSFTFDELRDLPFVISAPRFATYLQARANRPDLALALYRWNLEVSAAFMGPLHLCEITLRNGVAESIEAIHGRAWPWAKGFLRSLPSPKRGYNPQKDLRETAGQQPTAGKVVAELKFVFFGNGYLHNGLTLAFGTINFSIHSPAHRNKLGLPLRGKPIEMMSKRSGCYAIALRIMNQFLPATLPTI